MDEPNVTLELQGRNRAVSEGANITLSCNEAVPQHPSSFVLYYHLPLVLRCLLGQEACYLREEKQPGSLPALGVQTWEDNAATQELYSPTATRKGHLLNLSLPSFSQVRLSLRDLFWVRESHLPTTEHLFGRRAGAKGVKKEIPPFLPWRK
jgi:hypothetical protein